jgi:hypothetical protein
MIIRFQSTTLRNPSNPELNYSTIHNFRSSKLAILIQWFITLSDNRDWLHTKGNISVAEVKCLCGNSSKLFTAHF